MKTAISHLTSTAIGALLADMDMSTEFKVLTLSTSFDEGQLMISVGREGEHVVQAILFNNIMVLPAYDETLFIALLDFDAEATVIASGVILDSSMGEISYGEVSVIDGNIDIFDGIVEEIELPDSAKILVAALMTNEGIDTDLTLADVSITISPTAAMHKVLVDDTTTIEAFLQTVQKSERWSFDIDAATDKQPAEANA